jgi:hypothetical protein
MWEQHRAAASIGEIAPSASLSLSDQFLRSIVRPIEVEHTCTNDGRMHRVLAICFSDAFTRIQTYSICQFYGLAVRTLDTEDGYRLLRISTPMVPATDIFSLLPDGRSHPMAHVAAVRARLSTLLQAGESAAQQPTDGRKGDSSSPTRSRTSLSRSRLASQETASTLEAVETDGVLLEEEVDLPFVPLFLLHVKTMSE